MGSAGNALLVNDVVVVVPGIQGTQLRKDGEPVWTLSGKGLWHGLTTLGKNLKALELPADIGDEHPNDGVRPAGLMPDLHGVPGLGPFIGGYSDLVKWLRESAQLEAPTALRPGNLIEFGYDWRLSNRYSAQQLKKTAERELKRWRDDGHREAKLVLFCHSMGGLVARYYLEVLGGAEHTRTLVTVGTPHRGSVKALKNLVNGVKVGAGPLRLDVTALARSLPSSYQLLPTYRCIEANGGLQDLVTAGLGKLDAGRVKDAMDFHDEIGKAAAGNGASPHRFRMVVGTRQPTFATARVAGDRVEALWTIDGNTELGDGTVARFASIPPELEPDDLRQLSSAQRHGWLQQNGGVLDDLYGILTARQVVYMDDPPELPRQPGIEVPELIGPGESLKVRATSSDERLLLHATLAGADGRVHGRPAVFDNLRGGKYEATLDPPGEGVFTVTVSGAKHAKLEPITDAVMVAAVDPEE